MTRNRHDKNPTLHPHCTPACKRNFRLEAAPISAVTAPTVKDEEVHHPAIYDAAAIAVRAASPILILYDRCEWDLLLWWCRSLISTVAVRCVPPLVCSP